MRRKLVLRPVLADSAPPRSCAARRTARDGGLDKTERSGLGYPVSRAQARSLGHTKGADNMAETHENEGADGLAGADVRDANNHLKGTEFDVERRGADSPIRRGVITIDGARLRMAVYPAKRSRQGRTYCPVRLQYLPDCGYVLKAVPVGKVGVRS